MPERMIKVSIIVPCYNSEQFLVKCLDSLIAQTLADIEIICVNDASPDNGIEILRRYKRDYPDKVMVIDLPVNQRQGGARNEGMKAARGEYIGFTDPDDWVAPDMYESLYAVACEFNADIVASNLNMPETRDGDVVPGSGGSAISAGGAITDADRVYYLLGDGVMVLHSIFKRRMIIENELFFPRHLIYEDMVWTPIVKLYAERMYHIDRAFYYWYQNPESGFHKKNSLLHYDRIKLYPMLIAEAKRRGLYERFRDALDFRFINIYYIQIIHSLMSVMSEIELDKLYEIRIYMLKNMPEYRKNPHLETHKYITGISRAIMSLMDTDPSLAVEYLKTFRN